MLSENGIHFILGHIAFFLAGTSFFMRDIIYLRLISIMASIFAIFYAIFGHDSVLELQVYWHSVFICIHLFRLSLLMYEKYILKLTQKEKEIYDLFGWDISPAIFKKIIGLGIVLEESPGTELIEQGEKVSQIGFILDGSVKVIKDQKEVVTLKRGQFFGQFSFITGESASSSVFAQDSLKCIYWDQKILKKYLVGNENLLPEFQQVLTKKVLESLS